MIQNTQTGIVVNRMVILIVMKIVLLCTTMVTTVLASYISYVKYHNL